MSTITEEFVGALKLLGATGACELRPEVGTFVTYVGFALKFKPDVVGIVIANNAGCSGGLVRVLWS